MRRLIDALMLGAAVIGLASCNMKATSPGGGGGGSKVSAIIVGPPAASIAPGESVQLTATALDAGGSVLPGTAITWTSDNNGIASVSSSGLVTGVALGGPITVRAASGMVEGLSHITAAHLVFASVSLGPAHTCALTTSGAAYCWGDNTAGQTGNGAADTNAYTAPVAVVGPGGGAPLVFASLSANAGGFTCGRTAASAAYCWGDNSYGELGTGGMDLVAHPAPLQISLPGALSFATIDIGGGFACAAASNGAGYCWGLNSYGQLGTGDTLWKSLPTAVGGSLTLSAMRPGNVYTCAIVTGGAAWCWGQGKAGVLGTGLADTLAHPNPQTVSGGSSFGALSAGALTVCGVVGTDAYCWGRNVAGEVGNGTTVNAKTPAVVSGGLTFAAVAAGGFASCGLTSSGVAYCWGDNSVGELGIGAADVNAHTVPEAVAGGRTYAAIGMGRGDETCAVTTGGVLYCWGANSRGELGDGTTTERDAPVKVLGQP